MINKEKIISKLKENKVGLIICGVIFVGLLLLNLCRIITNNLVDDSSNNEPVKTEQLFLEHKINKVIFTTSNGPTNQYYFNSVVSMSASYLDNIENNPLMYFNNDTSTYLYCSVVNTDVNFYLTNGNQTQKCAVYTYDSANYQLNLVTTLSDGQFYSIVTDSINYYTFNNVSISTLNILIQTYDYVTNSMGTLYIGYQGNESFDYSYELGYQNGLAQGREDIMNNLVENGLYTTEQYEQNYVNGYNNALNNVTSNPNDYNLYTQTQYDDNYDLGYSTAENEVTPDIATSGFKTMFNSIMNAPYNIINGIINFEIFGINIFSLFSFLFTLALIAFVVKLLI